MDDAQSLCHTKWDCKYHVVWIPNCRRKVLFRLAALKTVLQLFEYLLCVQFLN